MELWTIMWITVFGGTLDGVVYGIPYDTAQACEEAIVAVSNTLPYDHNMVCETTDKASVSLIPKRNPIYSGGDE